MQVSLKGVQLLQGGAVVSTAPPKKCTHLLVGQSEVELFLFEVGACHLDAYWVAELILVVMATAHKAVVALVKVVVVVVEVAHRHKTLAVVLVNLAVDAVRLYARNVRVVDVAHTFRHEDRKSVV